MQAGDLVRLKTPFKPVLGGLEEYEFGILISFVETDPKGKQTQVQGVVLHLYDPQTKTVYCDPVGDKVLFHFQLNEVEEYSTEI